MSAINGYDFRTELAKLCPDYTIDQDNEGQIIIYTNLIDAGEDMYVPRKEEN
jgi:hypothetical protein